MYEVCTTTMKRATRDIRLDDTFEFEGVPFLVRVYDTDMFVHASTGEVRGINMHGAPVGMKRGGRKWVRCQCRVAKVRPDYSFKADVEWYQHVDVHVKVVEPFEVPERGLLFYGTTEANEQPRDPQPMAEDAIEELEDRYENADLPESLEVDV